ncbi:MAG TPA: hypothetical protein VET23_05310 [Chitinophagaceae bacterium]|nr:hypothetical protein [Chitinophagaceae bacterium]
MTKLRLQISVLVFLLLFQKVTAQLTYNLYIHSLDKDSSFIASQLGLVTSFSSRSACVDYINKLPGLLQSKGYVTASIDSLHYDSTFARLTMFTGEAYQWATLDAKQVDISILDAAGWRKKMFANKPMDFVQIQSIEQKMQTYLENNGYPFARIYLDSLQLDNAKVSALLKVDKGPPYRVDSIRVYGDVKISNNYLQRYLDISNGSLYSRDKLLHIDKKIRELAYIQEEKPSDITMLATGSVVNLHLKPKRSSQVYAIIGFLPNSDQSSSKKLLITGEGNLNLKNALGDGETIGLNFQALQVQSQRLNVIYQHPYLFNSPLGLDFSLDMFRKDSSFLNVNLQLGAQYTLSTTQSGKLFIQRFQTIVNGVNKAFILQNYRLPDEADMSSVNFGIDYEFNNTNYRLNPQRGNEFNIVTTVGTKNIKKNNDILNLKDPNNPSFDFGNLYDTIKLKTYQLRIRATVAKYLPLGKQSTI